VGARERLPVGHRHVREGGGDGRAPRGAAVDARESCSWDQYTSAEAAKNGHLELLRWMRANGCPLGERTCSDAAQAGHLEVLQWLRANGCPWDEHTCMCAAAYDRLEVLKWARANGCPWCRWTRGKAMSLGYVEDD
jgi:hypothetical protein